MRHRWRKANVTSLQNTTKGGLPLLVSSLYHLPPSSMKSWRCLSSVSVRNSEGFALPVWHPSCFLDVCVCNEKAQHQSPPGSGSGGISRSWISPFLFSVRICSTEFCLKSTPTGGWCDSQPVNNVTKSLEWGWPPRLPTWLTVLFMEPELYDIADYFGVLLA